MKFLLLTLLVALIGTLQSCKSHFTPSTIPVYGFTEAKQANVNASIGMNGIELQGAYSISKNTYLSGFYEGVHYSSNTRFRLYGLGIGYYKTIAKRGRLSLGSELLFGNLGARDLSKTNYSRDKVIRLLVNANIGTEFKWIEYYAGLRLGTYSVLGAADKHDFQFKYEPNFTLKLGPGRFKFFTQLGLSIPTTGWNDLVPIAHLGMVIETHKKPKSK